MINDQFTIGALAKASNVNVETIRYYQRIGLLPTPARDYGRIRRYTGENLKRMRFIRRAQHLGFSLDEIRLLLGLADDRHCAETRSWLKPSSPWWKRRWRTLPRFRERSRP
jgi:transcriptional regulator, MerR family